MSQGISYGGIENETQGSANTSIASNNYSHFHAPAHTSHLSAGTGTGTGTDKNQSASSNSNIDEYLYKYAIQLVSVIPLPKKILPFGPSRLVASFTMVHC